MSVLRNAVRDIVVVGSGIAGLTACDTLRAEGFDGRITVIGDEPVAPYSRPALSKAMLRDQDDLTSHLLPAATHGAIERRGMAAVGLDVDRQRVRLADGDEVPYDALVISTGTRARRLGLNTSNTEYTVRTLADALALRARLSTRPSVVVVGGGPLGMEIASGAIGARCATTLVAKGVPLADHLGALLAARFHDAALAQGLKIVTTDSAEIVTRDGASMVALGDGTVIEAQVIVSAIGDAPNVEWLANTGLLTGGALEVDRRGLVRPNIAAVGDVAAFPHAGRVARVPLWTSAIDQAKVAAAALLRRDAPELAFQQYFWTEAFGVSLKAIGPTPVAGEAEIVEGTGEQGVLRWRQSNGTATAVAIDYRVPIPKLRRVAA
ncbi:pyridine nucleotide-disulfide oxidoreductase (plasmid) [Burkholderia sp. SFA1]|uniref:NAD(P)/FAD-dependent oxidoreductase n=1 Tax=unclassified Caballeronia TaxID=2646786 RepID=UPI001F315B2A|nr:MULTISPECIES: FAD-dependent oxidoreductase [unclassified Caballeronia]MCE4547035.1 FAD-dependent oxidoreductase [Caballeronia sp. PC1]MCE4572492.1 FAD-dependent oxidoreductase [Caballeronia sp. CLC5]BBQ02139.1 pyridine nucleotide-disulfide oxidoreductase [Burkholderia sp. SFA1]